MRGFSVIWSTMPNISVLPAAWRCFRFINITYKASSGEITSGMSGGTTKTKLPDLELLDADFICSGTQPVFGVLWIPGRQTKYPIPVFQSTGHGDGTLYFLFHRYLVQILVQRLVTTTQIFSWFSSVPPWKCRDTSQMRPNPLSSTSIPLHYFTNDDIIQHYKSELLKLLLNKRRINKQEERDYILSSPCIF